MTRVESRSLAEMDYDPATRDLRVRYTTGALYVYHRVSPETYGALCAAPSKGSFVAHSIARLHDYTRLIHPETVPAPETSMAWVHTPEEELDGSWTPPTVPAAPAPLESPLGVITSSLIEQRGLALEGFAREFLDRTGLSPEDVVLCEQLNNETTIHGKALFVHTFWFERKPTAAPAAEGEGDAHGRL